MADTWHRITRAFTDGGAEGPSKITVTRVPGTKRVLPSTSTPLAEMFTSFTESPGDNRMEVMPETAEAGYLGSVRTGASAFVSAINVFHRAADTSRRPHPSGLPSRARGCRRRPAPSRTPTTGTHQRAPSVLGRPSRTVRRAGCLPRLRR